MIHGGSEINNMDHTVFPLASINIVFTYLCVALALHTYVIGEIKHLTFVISSISLTRSN